MFSLLLPVEKAMYFVELGNFLLSKRSWQESLIDNCWISFCRRSRIVEWSQQRSRIPGYVGMMSKPWPNRSNRSRLKSLDFNNIMSYGHTVNSQIRSWQLHYHNTLAQTAELVFKIFIKINSLIHRVWDTMRV